MSNTLKLGNGKWATGKDTLLSFSDTNNNYKPLPFSFSRASSATVVNKDGLIETVGSGEARIDFKDNTKGALLLEPSRTNIITYSSDFPRTYWTKSGASVVSGFVSPKGDLSAFKLVENSSNSSHSLQSPFVSGASGADTFSIFAKSDGRFNFSIVEDAYTGINVIVNLQDGTITTTGQQANIISLKNGWYRIDVTRADNSNPSRWLISLLDSSNNASYQGDGTSGVYIYGAQLEVGSYATSYIPTSGQANGVTRVADVCNNGGNEQVINSTEGVFYFEGSALADDGTNRFLSLNDGTTNNYIYFRYVSTSNQYLFRTQVGGVTVNTLSGFLSDTTQNHKFAFKFKSGDYAMWVDGVEISIDTSSTIFPSNTLSNLQYSFPTDEGGGFQSNTRDLRVYNTALTDAELQALTTI